MKHVHKFEPTTANGYYKRTGELGIFGFPKYDQSRLFMMLHCSCGEVKEVIMRDETKPLNI